MQHKPTATDRPVALAPTLTRRASADPAPPRWRAFGLLAAASLLLLALAGASAWLSYRAQVAYVLAHGGGIYAQARVWALLLDTGTAGVSLLRLYETLTARQQWSTRATLAACITASTAMNLLHTPSRTLGGYMVAAVPPLMYAVFLEHLLTNLRTLLLKNTTSETVGRSALLWLHFPAAMWRTWRGALRHSLTATPQQPVELARPDTGEVEQLGDAASEPEQAGGSDALHPTRRSGRRLGAKRLAFEAGLVELLRSGDPRPLSTDQRERNAAAYQVAASLPAPLSHGAARRYSVQAQGRLRTATDADQDLAGAEG